LASGAKGCGFESLLAYKAKFNVFNTKASDFGGLFLFSYFLKSPFDVPFGISLDLTNDFFYFRKITYQSISKY